MSVDLLPKTIEFKDDKLFLLNQTLLPLDVKIEEQKNVSDVWKSIKELKVRGAPAIGVAAGYGVLIGVKQCLEKPIHEFKETLFNVAEYLNSSRPTAVNLSWALERQKNVAKNYDGNSSKELYDLLKEEAIKIHKEDINICRNIGIFGAELISDGMGILTHCNAGALAASAYGTALAPIYEAWGRGFRFKVYSDETRPLLQGARLTSWELSQSGVDVTLICDNMAGVMMSKGLIDMVIVGCDRVAANGDTANKIGTMSVAILAKYFKIPFYVACPSSTFDAKTKNGGEIIIEERAPEEVTSFAGVRVAPVGIKVANPAFDVTPHDLITAFITEKGIIKPPFDTNLMRFLKG